MKSLPKWARYAIYGAVTAVAVDYFISPSARKTFGV